MNQTFVLTSMNDEKKSDPNEIYVASRRNGCIYRPKLTKTYGVFLIPIGQPIDIDGECPYYTSTLEEAVQYRAEWLKNSDNQLKFNIVIKEFWIIDPDDH